MAFNPPIVDDEIPSSAKLNSAVGLYERSTSAVDIVSSTTETDLYSKSIGAGHLSTDRALKLTLVGDYLNNTGSGRSMQLRIKFGATTLVDTGTTIVVASRTVRVPFAIEFTLANLGATNSQWLDGVIRLPINVTGTDFTTGLGNGAPTSPVLPMAGAAAEDSTVAATLAVTAQHSLANASLSIRKHYVTLELL